MTDKAVRVLIVDDEPPIRRFLRTALGHEGYEILEASDAKGALEGVAREAPHLVILDLGLPDLDGIEVIRRIRHESKVPILVLSSRGEERAKVEALELGAMIISPSPSASRNCWRGFAPRFAIVFMNRGRNRCSRAANSPSIWCAAG